MATYYVRPDGSDSNTGLGATTALAWRTVQKALGATGIGSGDIVYIAPGHYNETVTVGGTYSAETQIIGDPSASQFTGVNPGYVKLSQFASAGTSARNLTQLLISASKSYLHFKNLYFELAQVSEILMNFTNARFISFTGCVFYHNLRPAVGNYTLSITNPSGQTSNTTIQNCVFYNNPYVILQSVVSGDATVLKNNLFVNGYNEGIQLFQCTATVYNCTFAIASVGMRITGSSVVTANNCLFTACNQGVLISAGTYNENYNRYIGNSTNVSGTYTPGGNSSSTGITGIESAYSLLHSLNNAVVFGSVNGSQNASFGTATGAPTTDLFGVAWTGSSPDAGAITYRNPSGVGQYIPTERNASTITIAPGSTSQSIELYLGATGLTASTFGLSAYYNRTRSADVQINLQARNITQNWTSGGFAEVNPNTMPGVYRLDIPNEALVAGADDVTVVVRGASGTNGAVMSIKLSSGGLTTAQTASAVWNALTNDHTTHGTFGWNVLRADQDSKEGLVTLHQSGGVSRVDADIHAVVNDTAAATAFKGALLHDGTGYVDSDVVRVSTSTAAANELEGALLHNGTDYIDANLLSGNSTRVFVGRFQMTQTGTTQGDIIEAFTTDTPAFELQLFDGDNNLVPVTGATLGLRILDVTSTVVETGTPTIEYGTGGIVRWTAPGTYLSIGCPAGMYRLFVDRTVSGTTTTFGPLQIKVQVQ
jgi:hypothetical protein